MAVDLLERHVAQQGSACHLQQLDGCFVGLILWDPDREPRWHWGTDAGLGVDELPGAGARQGIHGSLPGNTVRDLQSGG